MKLRGGFSLCGRERFRYEKGGRTMSGYRYILRYFIDPGYHEEDRIEELLDFCRAAEIDEVMLFFDAEELNSGHITEEELAPWLAMAKKIKKRLARQGVDLSVNPWTTTVHSPRGRVLKPGQNFTLMVGETGKDNGVVACPLCPEWQAYLRNLWITVARELRPATIWIEDDWRYHNHGAVLGFGGCYCALHLRAFARRIGRDVTRGELLEKVFGEGPPHPWRELWFELNGRSIQEPVEQLRKAIAAEAPEVRLALMCAGVDVAGAEGRDWQKLQDAVRGDHPFQVRPTMSPYTEVWPMRKYPVQARMLIASLKRPLEIYPELESGPRHGAYSKGCGYAGWEILGTACFGAHGITINHYDMMGCGTGTDPRFGTMLRKLKPRLNALNALRIDDDGSLGANLLFRPDTAKHMQSEKAGTMAGLLNGSGEWGNVASILGFSYRCTTSAEHTGQPCLMGNQTPEAFSDGELLTLLKGTLVLDGKAAEVLLRRGFGNYLGIETAKLRLLRETGYAYEEISESDPAVYGLSYPRMTAQRAARRLFEFQAAATAEIPSWICRFDHKKLFPGSLVFRNELGGRVIILSYWLGDQKESEWFYMGFFNSFRRIFLQRLLRRNAPDMKGAFAEELPFQCYRVRTADGELIAALNSTTDPAESVRIRVTSLPRDSRLETLEPDGTWQSGTLRVSWNDDGSATLFRPGEVAVHEGVFFRITCPSPSAPPVS